MKPVPGEPNPGRYRRFPHKGKSDGGNLQKQALLDGRGHVGLSIGRGIAQQTAVLTVRTQASIIAAIRFIGVFLLSGGWSGLRTMEAGDIKKK